MKLSSESRGKQNTSTHNGHMHNKSALFGELIKSML